MSWFTLSVSMLSMTGGGYMLARGVDQRSRADLTIAALAIGGALLALS